MCGKLQKNWFVKVQETLNLKNEDEEVSFKRRPKINETGSITNKLNLKNKNLTQTLNKFPLVGRSLFHLRKSKSLNLTKSSLGRWKNKSRALQFHALSTPLMSSYAFCGLAGKWLSKWCIVDYLKQNSVNSLSLAAN